MTSQVPDEVRYRNDRYAITAVDGTGLFDPADGLRPAPGEPTSEWIHRTFSLGFDYSWPG